MYAPLRGSRGHSEHESLQKYFFVLRPSPLELLSHPFLADMANEKTRVRMRIINIYMYIHVLNKRCRRKEERSKQGHTNNKAKQHNTPEAVTFPKKNEMPVRVLV